jgi:cyanate permease
MPHTKQTYRWVMLALVWLVYASFGLVSGSMGVLVTPIVGDLGLSYSQMGVILGSWQLVFVMASIACGGLLDRWGVRRCILAGALLVTLSAVLRYFANGFATMLPAVALFGAGMPMISVGAPKMVSLWFTGKSRGTAVGICMTGAWAGGLLALALTNSVIMPATGHSWRTAILWYGIVVFVVGLLWGLLARDVKPESAVRRMAAIRVLRQIVTIRNVQLVLALGVIALATNHGVMAWLPRLLEAGGMSPAAAGFAASANMLAGVPAVMVLPHLIPAQRRGRTLAVCGLVAAASLAGVIGTSGVFQFAALLALGFAGSAFLPLLILILMDGCGIGAESLGSANGVFMSVAQIGGFLAPLMMGALLDMTGGFVTGILLLAALNIVVIPVTFALRVPTSAVPDD